MRKSVVKLALILIFLSVDLEASSLLPPEWQTLFFTTEQGDEISIKVNRSHVSMKVSVDGETYFHIVEISKPGALDLREIKYYIDPIPGRAVQPRVLTYKVFEGFDLKEQPFEIEFLLTIDPADGICVLERVMDARRILERRYLCSKEKESNGTEVVKPSP